MIDDLLNKNKIFSFSFRLEGSNNLSFDRMNDLLEVYKNISAVKMIHVSLSWLSDFSVFYALKWCASIRNTQAHCKTLTLSWRRFLSYRNHSIDLLCKSMDWFLYDRDFCHEGVNPFCAVVPILFWCFPWNKYSRKLESNKINGSIGTKRVRDRVQIAFLILSEFKRIC